MPTGPNLGAKPSMYATDPATERRDAPRPARRLRWVALVVLVVGLIAARSAFRGMADGPRSRDARIALLGTLRLAYPLFVLGLPGVGLVLGIALRSVKKRAARRGLARGLALTISTVIALGLAEAVAVGYLAWTHRLPAPRSSPIAKAERPDGGLNIVVVGESSAEGVPYRDWLSVGKVVAWQLRRAVPWRPVHLEVQARPGWTLEQMHQRLIESRSRADLVIVYAGHNEFASRFGWSSEASYYRDETPSLASLARAIGRFSPMARLIGELHETSLVAAPPRRAERRLVDVPSQSRAERVERLADFRRRLEGIVAYCESVGALPVLVIPPGNDAGYEPNRSVLPPETTAAERLAFGLEVEAARRLEATDPRESLRTYRDLIARQPGFAEAHFRLARLLEKAGDDDEAYRHYVAARDADGHPMRCPSDFQDVYRDVAARHGAVLVDGQAVFRTRGGQLDDVLFNDAMHPSFEGQVALAEAILAALKGRGALGWPSGTPATRIDPAECADHFDVNLAAWAAACDFAASFYRTMAPIRFDGAERRAKASRYGEALERLSSNRTQAGPEVPGIGLRQGRDGDRRLGRLQTSDQPLR